MCVCVCACVCDCSMDMEIVYYEQEGGVLQKVAELMVQTRNGASLEEICRDALRKVCACLFVCLQHVHDGCV